MSGKVIFRHAEMVGNALPTELKVGMRIDAYVQDAGLSCQLAEVILVADPLAITPTGATLLVTGN